MFLDRCKTFAADHMFNLACIACCNNRINAKLLKPFGKEKMTFVDFLCGSTTGFCQIKISFRRYSDLICLAELLHCDADAGLCVIQFAHDINGAHLTVFFLQHQDRFQIIFRRLMNLDMHNKPPVSLTAARLSLRAGRYRPPFS